MHHGSLFIYLIASWAVAVVIVILVFQFAGPRDRS
jgi:hypothetical protein